MNTQAKDHDDLSCSEIVDATELVSASDAASLEIVIGDTLESENTAIAVKPDAKQWLALVDPEFDISNVDDAISSLAWSAEFRGKFDALEQEQRYDVCESLAAHYGTTFSAIRSGINYFRMEDKLYADTCLEKFDIVDTSDLNRDSHFYQFYTPESIEELEKRTLYKPDNLDSWDPSYSSIDLSYARKHLIRHSDLLSVIEGIYAYPPLKFDITTNAVLVPTEGENERTGEPEWKVIPYSLNDLNFIHLKLSQKYCLQFPPGPTKNAIIVIAKRNIIQTELPHEQQQEIERRKLLTVNSEIDDPREQLKSDLMLILDHRTTVNNEELIDTLDVFWHHTFGISELKNQVKSILTEDLDWITPDKSISITKNGKRTSTRVFVRAGHVASPEEVKAFYRRKEAQIVDAMVL